MKRENRRHEIKITARLKQCAKDFLICGLTGWGLEILLTSAESLAAGDLKLMGKTSIYMFPIYGLGVLLGPIGREVDRWLDADRGEGRSQKGLDLPSWDPGHGADLSGRISDGIALKSLGICPWDYTGECSVWTD